ncbi:MAG: VanZ family protein [Gemmatimonadales bacterium]|nr:VanZ family protein [Gemmatimonadales bacterium]
MTSTPASPALGTGRRLGYLLVGYLAVVVGVITLAPFRFAVPHPPRVHLLVLDGGWIADILLNVALFVPIGLALHRTMRSGLVTVVLVAGGASLLIESLQLFLLPRYSTVTDVAANALGALLGAMISTFVDRRFGAGRRLVGRLMLDLPLMGVTYLLLPLLWLDGLGAAGSPARAWLSLPVVAAGALTLAAVARTVPSAATTAMGRNVVLAAVTWFAIGAVPALRTNPFMVGVGLVVVVGAAGLGQWAWRKAVLRDRRLEPQVVRVIVPLVLLYLILLALYPGSLSVAGGGDARVGILRWLEHVAALASLGYLLAEWRGRQAEHGLVAVAKPALLSGLAWVAIVSVTNRSAILAGGIVALVAGGFGATLYRRQRDHIIALGESVDQTG